MESVTPGLYRHFKGGLVEVLAVATHSETLEPYVVYKALYECRTHGKGSLWIRPLSMFCATVTRGEKSVPRFARLTNNDSTISFLEPPTPGSTTP